MPRKLYDYLNSAMEGVLPGYKQIGSKISKSISEPTGKPEIDVVLGSIPLAMTIPTSPVTGSQTMDYLRRMTIENPEIMKYSPLLKTPELQQKALYHLIPQRALVPMQEATKATLPLYQEGGVVGTLPYGLRADGTPKGKGYFGELKRPDGKISTELSVGFNIDGKEMEIPSIVPTLQRSEIDYLLSGGKPTDIIIRKAADHAKYRLSIGKSPFADEGEQVPLPEIRQTLPTYQKGGLVEMARDDEDKNDLIIPETRLSAKKRAKLALARGEPLESVAGVTTLSPNELAKLAMADKGNKPTGASPASVNVNPMSTGQLALSPLTDTENTENWFARGASMEGLRNLPEESPTEDYNFYTLQQGGTIPGGGKGDVVPIAAEPDEYIIPRDVVLYKGVEYFDKEVQKAKDKMQQSTLPPRGQKYQAGGFVQRAFDMKKYFSPDEMPAGAGSTNPNRITYENTSPPPAPAPPPQSAPVVGGRVDERFGNYTGGRANWGSSREREDMMRGYQMGGAVSPLPDMYKTIIDSYLPKAEEKLRQTYDAKGTTLPSYQGGGPVKPNDDYYRTSLKHAFLGNPRGNREQLGMAPSGDITIPAVGYNIPLQGAPSFSYATTTLENPFRTLLGNAPVAPMPKVSQVPAGTTGLGVAERQAQAGMIKPAQANLPPTVAPAGAGAIPKLWEYDKWSPEQQLQYARAHMKDKNWQYVPPEQRPAGYTLSQFYNPVTGMRARGAWNPSEGQINYPASSPADWGTNTLPAIAKGVKRAAAKGAKGGVGTTPTLEEYMSSKGLTPEARETIPGQLWGNAVAMVQTPTGTKAYAKEGKHEGYYPKPLPAAETEAIQANRQGYKDMLAETEKEWAKKYPEVARAYYAQPATTVFEGQRYTPEQWRAKEAEMAAKDTQYNMNILQSEASLPGQVYTDKYGIPHAIENPRAVAAQKALDGIYQGILTPAQAANYQAEAALRQQQAAMYPQVVGSEIALRGAQGEHERAAAAYTRAGIPYVGQKTSSGLTEDKILDAWVKKSAETIPIEGQVEESYEDFRNKILGGNRSRTMNTLPDPKQHKGRVVVDTQGDKRYKSDGTKWVEVR